MEFRISVRKRCILVCLFVCFAFAQRPNRTNSFKWHTVAGVSSTQCTFLCSHACVRQKRTCNICVYAKCILIDYRESYLSSEAMLFSLNSRAHTQSPHQRHSVIISVDSSVFVCVCGMWAYAVHAKLISAFGWQPIRYRRHSAIGYTCFAYTNIQMCWKHIHFVPALTEWETISQLI